ADAAVSIATSAVRPAAARAARTAPAGTANSTRTTLSASLAGRGENPAIVTILARGTGGEPTWAG
ncbi:MAG TPA: hypothetical protein VGI86_18270, partial [Acidimicrobiia bacterium]